MAEATICLLLREAAEALTANDPARLADLGPVAAQVKVRSEELARALEQRNALEGILKATAGNLRLLHRVRSGAVAGYEVFRP